MLRLRSYIAERNLQAKGEMTLRPHTAGRAYTGEQAKTKTKMAKHESGALGEKIAVAYLKHIGHKEAHPLNHEKNNYPVDAMTHHHLVEVKTGMASNGASARKWRATIGQPGKAESAALKKMSPTKKAAWNQDKAQAIMDRKHKVLKDMSKKHGVKLKPTTIATIVHPDKKLVDVHHIEGFHHSVGWNSDTAKKSYVGTFSYG